MYSVMWSEHCSYKSSRAFLVALSDRGAVGARRAGRGRGRRRHRRRPGGRGAHREPQPPVRGRAVPGRGDGRRRHHPRHLLDGGAPDRADGSVAVRLARRRAHPLPVRGRRVGHLRLRQLGRRADGRRRGRVRRHVPRQPVGERVLPRHPARRSGSCSPAPRARATSRCCSGRRPGRDGIGGASVLASASLRRRRRGQAPVGAGRRPVRGEAAHRGVPRAARRQARGRCAGSRRGRALVRGVGDRGQGAAWAWTSTSRASPSASRA